MAAFGNFWQLMATLQLFTQNQLDGPAGWTSWTGHLYRPAGQTSLVCISHEMERTSRGGGRVWVWTNLNEFILVLQSPKSIWSVKLIWWGISRVFWQCFKDDWRKSVSKVIIGCWRLSEFLKEGFNYIYIHCLSIYQKIYEYFAMKMLRSFRKIKAVWLFIPINKQCIVS